MIIIFIIVFIIVILLVGNVLDNRVRVDLGGTGVTTSTNARSTGGGDRPNLFVPSMRRHNSHMNLGCSGIHGSGNGVIAG